MIYDKIRLDANSIRAGLHDDTVLSWVEEETILFDVGNIEKQAEYLMDMLASRDTLTAACNWRTFVLRNARERYIEQCVAKEAQSED